VTTSQEDYDKAGSTLPYIGGALAGAGLGAAAASRHEKENLIPESSLPMGEGAGSSLDAGPFMQSSGPTSTTADLAGKVPLEERKQATVVEPESAASGVPEMVKESMSEAHRDPEAAASAEAVKEKSEVEQELLAKVHSTDEAGEPAPTITAATSETAPGATHEHDLATSPPSGTLATTSAAAAAVSDGTEENETPNQSHKTIHAVEKTEGDNTEYAPPHVPGSAPGVSSSAAAALSDGTEDPTLAEEPAVRMMNQNETESQTPAVTETPSKVTESAAVAPSGPSTTEATKVEAPLAALPQSKKEAVKDTVASSTSAGTSSATSTPKKTATTTPTSSPASTSKEKKKKNRLSSLFKKIFD
jgi:hypothetical protein